MSKRRKHESNRPNRRDPLRGARAFGYARVSGAEQERSGTSLEAQQAAIRAACATRGLPEPRIYVEVDSGANESRVELGRLIAALREGDHVFVTRVDRWSRDIPHAVKSVRDLLARNIRWFALDDNIDAATPHGNSMLGILAWGAEQERLRIHDRLVGTRRRLRDEGYYVEGLAPVGYRRHARTLVVVPEEVPMVHEVYQRCAAGQSLREISRAMRRMFPERHKWDHHTLHSIIASRTYRGEVRDRHGEWIEGRHEAMVDERLWQRAQRGLASRRKGGRRCESPVMLRAPMAECGACGAVLNVTWRPSSKHGRIYYYACLHGRHETPYVRAEETDEAVGEMVLARLAELRHELARGEFPAPPPAKAARAAVDRLRKRRERIIDALADGTLAKSDVSRRLRELDAELAEAEDELERQESIHAAGNPAARKAALKATATLREAWAKAEPRERREIVSLLVDLPIVLARGQEPAITWRPASELVVEL